LPNIAIDYSHLYAINFGAPILSPIDSMALNVWEDHMDRGIVIIENMAQHAANYRQVWRQ